MTRVLRFAEIASTQEAATARAVAGAPSGTVLVADRQTAGRGRLDHRWESPPGGLYLSAVLGTPRHAPELATLAVAVEIARWMESDLRVYPRIRWPNDLWLADPPGKVGGVIADRVDGAAGARVVLGVGLNVAVELGSLPEPLRRSATTLRDRATVPPTVRDAEIAVLSAIDRSWELLDGPSGAGAVVRAVAERLDGVGRAAALDGDPIGRIVGVGEDGALWAERLGTRTAHRAGSIAFLDDAGPGGARESD